MAGTTIESFSFSDGVLHIDVPLSKARLRWHPGPKAEELKVGLRRWREFWPDYRLIRPVGAFQNAPEHVVEIPESAATPESARQKAVSLERFRSEVDDEVVRIVEPFGGHQWALMVLVRNEPWAMDLALSNPTLAYAFANSYLLRGSPPEAAAVQARWYCHKKQRDLLEWLGFPGTEAVAKLIRKIPPESASPAILYRLSHALKADKRVLEYTSRLAVVNAAVIELVAIPRYLDVITPKLLAEVACRPTGASIGDMIHGGMIIRQQIYSHRQIRPFESIRQVCRFREEVDEEQRSHAHRQELARQEAERFAEQELHRLRMLAMPRRRTEAEKRKQHPSRPFPPPPVPGTQDIVPLTGSEQLHLEGWEQANCVATYQWRVLAGDTYVYKVLAPERATLSIVRCADGRWYRSELNVEGNRKVKKSTAIMVDAWLEESQQPSERNMQRTN